MIHTKEKVLIEAEKLFLSKGIMNTSMSDIANIFGVDRRSIYRIFETKEAIAYQIAITILAAWNKENEKEFSFLTGSGIEKLEVFLNRLIDDMSEKSSEMRFLTEFDFYFRDTSQRQVDTKSKSDYDSIVMGSNKYLKSLLEDGIKDGSIVEDLDVGLMESTMSNVLWSFGQSISIRRNAIQRETGINPIMLIKNQVKLYIKAIKK